MERYNIYDDKTLLNPNNISLFFDDAIFSIKHIISTYENKSYYKDEYDEDIKYQMRENILPTEFFYDMIAMLYIVTNTVMDSFSFMKGDLLKRYNLNEEDIKPRLAFYDKIAKKYIEVRGESLFFDVPPSILNNPILCCATAFCDILKNPTLIDDYADAPVVIEEIEKNIEFIDEVAMPIIEAVAKYASKIMQIMSNILEREASLKGVYQPYKNNTSNSTKESDSSPIPWVLGTAFILILIIGYFL